MRKIFFISLATFVAFVLASAVCIVKWNKGGKVSFKAGSDDPETTWINGEVVCVPNSILVE